MLLHQIIILLLTIAECKDFSTSVHVSDAVFKPINHVAVPARKVVQPKHGKVLQSRSPMDVGESSGSTGHSLPNVPDLDGPRELIPAYDPSGTLQLFDTVTNTQLGALGAFDQDRRQPWLFHNGLQFRAAGRTVPWQFRGYGQAPRSGSATRNVRSGHMANFPVVLLEAGRIGNINLRYDVNAFVAHVNFIPNAEAFGQSWFAARQGHLQSLVFFYGMVDMDRDQFIPPLRVSLNFPRGHEEASSYDTSPLTRANRHGIFPGYSIQPEIEEQDIIRGHRRRIGEVVVPVVASYSLEPLQMTLEPPTFRFYWMIFVVEYEMILPPQARGRRPRTSRSRGGRG